MNNLRLPIALLLLVAGLLPGGDAWSAQAGRVQFVNGEVQVTDAAGRMRAAQKGDAINEGDTVTSAKAASAQIKMQDGGFIAVRPDTQLKFDSFKFSGKEGEPENSFFSLFKGGFRAVTGLIGRVNRQDYRITTPAATIGIRGTDHETVMVLPDNPLVLARGAEAGAYNKVNVGETSITTDKGTINVLPNQMGFAGGLDQMPQIKPININLFTVTPTPAPGAKRDEGKGEGKGGRDTAVVDNAGKAAAGDSTPTTSGPGNTTAPPGIVPPSVIINPIQTLVTPLPIQAAGGIGLFYTDPSGTWSAGGGGTVQATSTQSGGLAGFVVNNNTWGSCITNCTGASFQSGSLGSASILDQGANVLAGNLHWGRWFGQGATVTGLPPGATFLNSNLTYIGGDIPTMPITGTATYIPIGGTSPVDAAGRTGTFLGANVSVVFMTPSITVSNMQVAFAGNTYTMAGSGSFQSNGVIPSVPMTGTCTGTCAGSMNGDYAGSFTGVNAAGLALAYHIVSVQSPMMPPTFEIMGSQGFIKR